MTRRFEISQTNHPAVRDHPCALVGISRLRRAVVAAHNAQGGHRANAVGAGRWDYFQEEPGRVVHVLSGVNWLQRNRIVVHKSEPVNKLVQIF